MLISTLFSDPFQFVASIVALVVGITVHEFSHALAATRLGDPTPASMGRVSLNPLRHLDPFGTLFLIVAGFGWGKPVIFNP
ncbi:MAG: site-2 protease family protein, partial [Candidatus Andersenbacteria bacterium]